MSMDPKKDKTPVAGGANKSPASGGKRPATGSQTTPPVKATCSQTAAMKATLVEPLGDSPSKKRKPTNPAPKKVESRPEEEAPPVPPPVPGSAEEKPAGDDGPKEANEAGGSSGGGAKLEDDAAKRDKGKAVAEGDGEEEADQDDDAGKAVKDGGDGEPQPGGGGAAPAERTIIIEHRRKGRKLFKQRADELNPGFEIAVPGSTVLLNPELPAVQDPVSSVTRFERIFLLTPDGQYNAEFHRSFLRLQRKEKHFEIQYNDIAGVFVLPKPHTSFTLVIMSLDLPIQKKNILYPHIVFQFDNKLEVQQSLSISTDLLNGKYKDKLEASYNGRIDDVFTAILLGFSGAKVTKQGEFNSFGGEYDCHLNKEYGLLYPLEESLFFLPTRPTRPTLVLLDEIDYVDFERRPTVGTERPMFFDLPIRLKTGQPHLFNKIHKNEHHGLYKFLKRKDLRILGMEKAVDGCAVPGNFQDSELARLKQTVEAKEKEVAEIPSSTDVKQREKKENLLSEILMLKEKITKGMGEQKKNEEGKK